MKWRWNLRTQCHQSFYIKLHTCSILWSIKKMKGRFGRTPSSSLSKKPHFVCCMQQKDINTVHHRGLQHDATSQAVQNNMIYVPHHLHQFGGFLRHGGFLVVSMGFNFGKSFDDLLRQVGQEVKFQAYLHNGRLQGRELQERRERWEVVAFFSFLRIKTQGMTHISERFGMIWSVPSQRT